MREISVFSAFDGISCLRQVLHNMGFKVKHYFASEINEKAIKVSLSNWDDVTHLGDIRYINIDNLPKIDLFAGGSPCQGFSQAGKRKGFLDPRSKLFYEWLRIYRALQGRGDDPAFLLENVRMKKRDKKWISSLLKVEPVMINSDLLSAQRRIRYYWTNIGKMAQPKDRGILLNSVLQDEFDLKYLISLKGLKYMDRKTKDGRSHWDFGHHGDSDDDKARCVTAAMRKGVPYNVLIQRGCRILGLRIDERGKRADHREDLDFERHLIMNSRPYKSNCITTIKVLNVLAVELRTNQASPTQSSKRSMVIRNYTEIECERLQGLPDNYTQAVNLTARYECLGNAWQCDTIEYILKHWHE